MKFILIKIKLKKVQNIRIKIIFKFFIKIFVDKKIHEEIPLYLENEWKYIVKVKNVYNDSVCVRIESLRVKMKKEKEKEKGVVGVELNPEVRWCGRFSCQNHKLMDGEINKYIN